MGLSSYKQSFVNKPSGASLSTDLFARLQNAIISKKYKRGEKITEQMICEEYQVSRTPVREAFKQLELLGLIEMIPNRGAFVAGITESETKDLYELRKSSEILAVRWGVVRIEKKQFEQLEEAYEFMKFYTQKRDFDKMLNINTDFHRIVYMSSHNKMLERALLSYQAYTLPYRKTSSRVVGYMDDILDEHKGIFQAFQLGNPDFAEKAVVRHLENAKKRAD